jgi:hypothetical protein
LAVDRDQTAAAMFTVSERMTSRYCEGTTLTVQPNTRGLFKVVQGLLVSDNWTDVFEPVRTRRRFSDHWTEVQSVQDAAAKIGVFLRERPDQAGM